MCCRTELPLFLTFHGGSFVEPANYDRDFIRFVGSIPYDWAFPTMYALCSRRGGNYAVRY
jgi:hypothetical protein